MTDFADISHHNGAVNLAVYDAAGHDRFALKATEDTGFVDSAFAARWAAGAAMGRMPYHFLRNHSPGAQQFAHFNAVVPPLGKRDMLVLDVEDIDTPGDAAKEMVAFCKAAAAAGYTRGIIYTYKFYGNDRGITAGILPPGWRQLWLADYKSAVLDKDIVLPNGWTRSQVVARQFTSSASVPGIAGLSDYNRVYRDWLATAPPPPAGDDGLMAWSDADSANLKYLADYMRGLSGSQYNYGLQSGVDVVPAIRKEVHELSVLPGDLDTANGHLAAIHDLLSQLAGALPPVMPQGGPEEAPSA